ncbi:MAG: aromatic-ring-hydroxylating dioxygenase subunit beta [Actinomycetota bacterium]
MTTVETVAAGTELLVVRAAIEDFLYDESAALDEGRYMEWLEMLTDDFLYTVPMPMPRDDPSESQYHETGLLASGSKGAFDLRLRRIGFASAWGDRPRPYGRHLITNIRITPADAEDAWRVKSNVLVTRSRGNSPLTFLSAGRVDVIRGEPSGGFKLAQRAVYIDVEAPSHASLLLPF